MIVKPIHRVSTVIRQKKQLAQSVALFELADPDGWELPPFSAGAHVDVHMPSGLIRQYSLCGDPDDRTSYSIAVHLDTNGRGGSEEMHKLNVGAELLLSLPRNMMPLVDSSHVVFVAGGIGITPFVPMMIELFRAGRTFKLHYAAKSRERAAFEREIAGAYGSSVQYYFSEQKDKLDVSSVVDGLKSEDHLYCCGPVSMIEEVLDHTSSLRDRTHVEVFGANPNSAEVAYDVNLLRSQKTVHVVEGQTMLEALRLANVVVPSSCEAGICLECVTRYTDGEPIHRDIMLPKDQKSRFLTPCVSGCTGRSITLDL